MFYQKAKLKLGKGKQVANNATDTSFKARCRIIHSIHMLCDAYLSRSFGFAAVALPKQSVTVVLEDSVPTTRRNLTFETLLGQMKHYNSSVRKGLYPHT